MTTDTFSHVHGESLTYAALAKHLGAAFAHGPATRDDLIDFAISSAPTVAAAVAELPYPVYETLRELWHDLAERQAAISPEPIRGACM